MCSILAKSFLCAILQVIFPIVPMDDNNVFSDGTFDRGYSRRSSRAGAKRFVLVIIAVIILAALGFGAYTFLGSSKAPEVPPTPTPTPFVFPTDTPTPPVSPTPEKATTPEPTVAGSTIDKTTGLDRSKLTVTVQNGSGVVGAATKGANVLKGLGYKVVSTSNADNYTYTDVTIQVKAEKKGYAPVLKSDLSKEYTVQSVTSDLSASSSADALVIIGK